MPTKSTVDLSEIEALFVKEEVVTNDAEVFGEVVVDVEGSASVPLAYVSCPHMSILRT